MSRPCPWERCSCLGDTPSVSENENKGALMVVMSRKDTEDASEDSDEHLGRIQGSTLVQPHLRKA